MGTAAVIRVRHETRTTERRAPLVPADAARLVTAGVDVEVERSPQRAFPDPDYAAAGCRLVPTGSWPSAPRATVVLGLKELPEQPAALVHRHVFFGHAYKDQPGAAALLERFRVGGGALLDLEYLTDDAGRRLAAFGRWAGYTGAALGVQQALGRLAAPLVPTTRDHLDAAVRHALAGTPPRVLVIGARGRSGRGAVEALERAGLQPTPWDATDTRDLDRDALLAHDVLVNAVLASGPTPPFVTPDDLDRTGRRLRTIVDVTCDAGSPWNVLPVYDRVTSWERPARRLRDGDVPVDLIAIDNLPSLLPAEASTDFSADLAGPLARLASGGDDAWRRCAELFDGFAGRGRVSP